MSAIGTVGRCLCVLMLAAGCGSAGSNAGSGLDAGDGGGGVDSSDGGADAIGGSSGAIGGSGGAEPDPEPCASGTWDHDDNVQTDCVTWTECAPGQFVATEGSASEDQTCSGCESGSFSTVANAAECSEWTACTAGEYVSTDGSATTDQGCKACVPGTFTSGSNQAACVPEGECAPGTYQTMAGTATTPPACEACATGSYCAGAQAAPQACPSDTWDHDEDPATECAARTGCIAGQYIGDAGSATTDRTCTACTSGTYSTSANAESCTAWTSCDAGQFVSTDGSGTADRSCSGCASGTFSATSNADACTAWIDCEAGDYISVDGSTTADQTCASCADGTYTSGSNQSACVPEGECAPGTYQTAEGTATTPATCAACATGTYCAGAEAAPRACASDTWDHDADPATECVARTECTAGQYVGDAGSATTDRTCPTCTSGTYSASANAESCTAWTSCDAGQFVSTPGSGTADQSCSGCTSGTFSATSNASSCSVWKDCEAGDYISVAGGITADQTCADCADGTYTSGSNQSACVPQGECAPGTYQTAAGTATTPAICEACATGTYCAGAAAAPQACASDTWDHDADPATECAARTGCTAGQYVGNAGSATTDRTCTACASGSYSTSANAESCTAWTSCDAGQFVNTAGSGSADRSCSGCASGTFSITSNASSCSVWKDCEAGDYISVAGSTTADQTCAGCADGTYTSASNQSACVPQGECAPGKLQTVPGSATQPPTCVACSAGTYCAGAGAAAVPCAAQTWDQDNDPATDCIAKSTCVAGEFVTGAGTSTSDRTCGDCAPKTYSDAENAVSCKAWTDCGTYAVATPGTTTQDATCGAGCALGYVDLGGCKSAANCSQLHELAPTLPSGDYVIDPDATGGNAAFTASCDMATDGGGWTLVLNYVHKGGTNPALDVRTANLPLLGSAVLGGDSSGTTSWGHASQAMMAQLSASEVRFYGQTSAHNRVMHFATGNTPCLSYFEGGSGDCRGLAADYRALANHATNAPGIGADGFTNQGNAAMTEFPFYHAGAYHWGVRGGGSRWEMDDFAANAANHTVHQIWVRSHNLLPNCAAILAGNSAAANGVYRLDPDGNLSTVPIQAHCDMVTDGGGWTLVLKANGDQNTFAYTSALWSNQTLYNANAPNFDTTEAKLGTFNSTPFSALLMRMQVPLTSGAVRSLRINHVGSSLYAVMSTNSYTTFNTPPARADWKALAGPTASLQNNCNRQGFNVQPGYASIRIGILGNQENDCGSPDSYIGVGGQDSPCLGGHAPTAGGSAGCGGDNGNYHFPGFVWVYVR